MLGLDAFAHRALRVQTLVHGLFWSTRAKLHIFCSWHDTTLLTKERRESRLVGLLKQRYVHFVLRCFGLL